MKIACLVLTMTCWAMIHVATSASKANLLSAKQSSGTGTNAVGDDRSVAEAPADETRNGKSAKSSNEAAVGRRASDKSHLRTRPGLMNRNSPKQLAANPHHSSPPDVTSVRQHESDRSRAIQGETARNGVRIAPSSGARAGAPLPSNVRHRGPNPATIGGADSNAKNSGGINGTRMPRRP
jgi:hypothetical protein